MLMTCWMAGGGAIAWMVVAVTIASEAEQVMIPWTVVQAAIAWKAVVATTPTS
jgi:hypothetical protein